VKAPETEVTCNAVFVGATTMTCQKKPGHWGKHYDGAGTTWSSAGATRLKEEAEAARLKEEAEAARLQKE
jgi:hypothetical protein